MLTTPPPRLTRESLVASSQVVELASGIDALYLSGKAELSDGLFEALEERRLAAVEAEGPVPFEFAGTDWRVAPHSFGKYRYCLDHLAGRIGITKSKVLPALRVQPRAEHLHGMGPSSSLRWFQRVGEVLAGGPVEWSLSRMDLFCDVQGWSLVGDDRYRFICRATRRDLHEESEAFTGFEFGHRSTKTVCARIYDKTLQVDRKGIDWWPEVWGDAYDERRPVLRIEFEIGRQGLVEHGINTPEEGLELAPALWAAVTDDWLSYRTPGIDETKSRWPIAPEWLAIRKASLRDGAIGMERVRAGLRQGSIRRLTPSLVGYLAAAGALLGADDLDSTLSAVGWLVKRDERVRGIAFEDRIAERVARELWL